MLFQYQLNFILISNDAIDLEIDLITSILLLRYDDRQVRLERTWIANQHIGARIPESPVEVQVLGVQPHRPRR